MLVKICGITTLQDAVLAAEAGATAIGFNFFPESPRYIQPEDAARIAVELPATLLKAGIFVSESPAHIREIAAIAQLDVVQLYGSSSAEGIRIWRACRVEAGFSEAALVDKTAEAFLLDTPAGDQHGGTGTTFDWHAARGLARRIILAGGLDAGNVRMAIETVRPWGVDACSRLESAPGRKDPRKVREFVKAALSIYEYDPT